MDRGRLRRYIQRRFRPDIMKLVPVALLLMVATLHAATVPAQTVERWQTAAVLKYPALKQPGSPLNQQFLAVIAGKRKSDPAFFTQPDWPMRAAELAVSEMLAAETAAKEKAKADELAAKEKARLEEEKARAEATARRSMTREEKAKMDKAEISQIRADEAKEWEAQRDKWVFDRLMFGDSEDVVMRKLALSKLVTARVSPSTRVELSSRYRWVIGERNFNIDFEMKDDKLTSLTFGCLSERTTELDTLVHEDWDKLRAAVIERFGPPTKSTSYPTKATLRRGGMSVTDEWKRPSYTMALGVAEDESKCNPSLHIGDAASGAPSAK